MKFTAVKSCYEKPLKSEVFYENIDFDMVHTQLVFFIDRFRPRVHAPKNRVVGFFNPLALFGVANVIGVTILKLGRGCQPPARQDHRCSTSSRSRQAPGRRL